MNILGINPGHNGSVAYLVDGKLVFYAEEERLSRIKYDCSPFRGILETIGRGNIDVVGIGGPNPHLPKLFWSQEDAFSGFIKKYNPNVKTKNFTDQHHITHAATAFYNSGFETAVAVIADGCGSPAYLSIKEEKDRFFAFETESIIHCSYPSSFEKVYESLANGEGKIPKNVKNDNNFLFIHDSVSITKAYEAVSNYLGFGILESGKTMGLSPYGQENDRIPNMFINGYGDKNTFLSSYPSGSILNDNNFEIKNYLNNTYEWHHDPSKVTEFEKDLAFKVQKETQELVGDLIEKAYNITGETNILVSGGYGLNCMANYYLQKRFPDLNIYFEPVSHDGGTAIGIAKMIHHAENQDTTIRPQTTLYHGVYSPDYSSIHKIDREKIKVHNITKSEVAKIISEKNIVAIYQGRSEAGPRALGNRSILYDPRDKNGKDYVNTVKGREWFRPFAGSILVEEFQKWFKTYGLKETPYMMHAMEFKDDKQSKVPAITHVDNTCRIQTVSKKQNQHFYDLIEEFYKLTNVPILFNTSFNLGGEPLVETIQDAINTCINGGIKYLYFPEVDKLMVYTNVK